ncbi:hypothetical protein CCACVL1_12652 [Corchorus capsularis]|uniref:Uncharacterized protein n=1 Tax=Corchorus capsularis TaxID=210143 RepID=A0A1R3IEM4_COCAP|nr:hypothetical protein CCACVL1_12652 [Corchorus capsularis]
MARLVLPTLGGSRKKKEAEKARNRRKRK